MATHRFALQNAVEGDMEAETTQASENNESSESKPEQRLSPEGPKVDVSAATITRMMGIATVTDLKLLESRLDLLTAKVTTVVAKVGRILTSVNALPNSSDMDRIEIQLGSVKSVMREVLEALDGAGNSANDKGGAAAEQSKKIREGIRTNTEAE
jgi:hypothetical protein